MKQAVYTGKDIYDALPNNTFKIGIPALVAYAAK